MSAKSLIFTAIALASARFVSAQAAPAWQYVPVACASQCAQTVETSYLCSSQFQDSTDVYGCFCNSFPSDATTCASCLNSNNAAALGQLLTSTQTACPQAKQSCFFQCSFDTCASTDISCQCSATYLKSIYNCGACNTANGNTQATQLKDWQALQQSCLAQNFTGAQQSFTTSPIASATGQANYKSVTLTASGGGAAATGGAALTAGGGSSAPTTISGGAVASSAASSVSLATGTSTRAASSAGSASSAGASAAATTSRSAASGIAAPALGGFLAAVGALVAAF